jgi:hypothetical protein
MPLELWALLALAGAGVVVGIVNRLRRRGRPSSDGKSNNVYPLW